MATAATFRGFGFGSAIVLASALLYSPALQSPFYDDDIGQLAVLENQPSWLAARGPLDLYRFFDGDPASASWKASRGLVPWWFDASQRVGFFRPLSSALMWMDHSVCGFGTLGAHAHSVLWLLLLFAVASALYSRFLPGNTRLVATLFFVLQPTAARAVVWWCARHVLVSAALSLCALLAFIHWREGRRRYGLPVALIAFSLALLASESGFQVFGYLVAYAMYERFASARPWDLALRSLVPFAGVAIVYLLARVVLGYAVQGNGFYVDPFVDPGAFVQNGLGMVGTAVTLTLFSPLELIASGVARDDRVLSPIALGGAALFGYLAVMSWRHRAPGSHHLVWLVAGSLIALVACFSSATGVRSWTLILPRFGAAAALAIVVSHGLSFIRAGGPRRLVDVTGVFAALVFASVNLIGGLYAVPASCASLVGRARQNAMTLSGLHVPRSASRLVVVRGGRASLLNKLWFYRPDIPLTTVWRLSDPGGGPCIVRRAGPNVLELAAPEGTLLPRDFFRAPSRALRTGDAVVLDGLMIRIAEADSTGVRRVRVQFDRSLDEPVFFVAVEQPDGRLARLELPSLGGEQVLHGAP